jgi:hypothetical protein
MPNEILKLKRLLDGNFIPRFELNNESANKSKAAASNNESSSKHAAVNEVYLLHSYIYGDIN